MMNRLTGEGWKITDLGNDEPTNRGGITDLENDEPTNGGGRENNGPGK